MTPWTDLLSASADGVILIALAAAVASRKLPPLARPVIATLGFACAWLLAAGFDALGVRGWALFLGGAVIAVSVVVITVTLHLWAVEDDGGVGPRRRSLDAPQPGGDGGAPSWWPDFERQFGLYVAERESETRQTP